MNIVEAVFWLLVLALFAITLYSLLRRRRRQ
jgi:hypothetical protein